MLRNYRADKMGTVHVMSDVTACRETISHNTNCGDTTLKAVIDNITCFYLLLISALRASSFKCNYVRSSVETKSNIV